METKTKGLATAVWQLKRDIDVHEMILSNIDHLHEKACDSFFGYVYWRSLNSIIVNICKIYEKEKTNEGGGIKFPLNSIGSICNKIELDKYQLPEPLLSKFLKKYGNVETSPENKLSAFAKITRDFGPKYSKTIAPLKKYRDQHGAHNQEILPSTTTEMPSLQDIMPLYQFAYDFCELVNAKEGLVQFIDDKITMATKKIITRATELHE